MSPAHQAPGIPRRGEWLLTLPSLAWIAVFFAAPALVVFLLAFRIADATGGVAGGWTLDNFRALGERQYEPILWRTLWISGLTTLICLAVALPVSFQMARAGGRWKNLLLLLIIIPFWTNFLIRVFAWKALLQSDGPVSQVLEATHLFDEAPGLLYNSGAVLFIMVYTQLPFAILPLYAAAERFDFTLLEAARDLGSSGFRAFCAIFVPGISRALGTAALIVFVTTIGMYVVPDIVGGTDSEMIGNKIAQRAQSDRNLPLAAALSAELLLVVILLLFAGWGFAFRKSLPRSARADISPISD